MRARHVSLRVELSVVVVVSCRRARESSAWKDSSSDCDVVSGCGVGIRVPTSEAASEAQT